jgi:hypothetical protein
VSIPVTVYEQTSTPARLVPGSELHVEFLACRVHVEPQLYDSKLGSAEMPKCVVARDDVTFDASALARWLATTFHLVADESGPTKLSPPPDRVLVVTTADDAPPIIDNGCLHVDHPCDPGPGHMIDPGQHTETVVYVLGKIVPLDLANAGIGGLLELLGWQRLVASSTQVGSRTTVAPAGLPACMSAP